MMKPSRRYTAEHNKAGPAESTETASDDKAETQTDDGNSKAESFLLRSTAASDLTSLATSISSSK